MGQNFGLRSDVMRVIPVIQVLSTWCLFLVLDCWLYTGRYVERNMWCLLFITLWFWYHNLSDGFCDFITSLFQDKKLLHTDSFLLGFVLSKTWTTTKSNLNLNSHDLALDLALTHNSTAPQITFDPLWHHLSSTSIPCVCSERPLKGKEWTSHFTFIVTQAWSGLSMVCRAPSWMRWAALHDGHRKALNSSTQSSTVFLKTPWLLYNDTWGSFNYILDKELKSNVPFGATTAPLSAFLFLWAPTACLQWQTLTIKHVKPDVHSVSN